MITSNNSENKVYLGLIKSKVGLKGDMKVLLYANSPSWTKKSLKVDFGKRTYDLSCVQYPYLGKKDTALLRSKEISDPFFLTQQEFYIYRDELEQDPDYIYLHDLLGAEVFCNNKKTDDNSNKEDNLHKKLGHLKTTHDFGAGIILELDNGEMYHAEQIDKIVENKIYLKDFG